jgi:hypothetical protein
VKRFASVPFSIQTLDLISCSFSWKANMKSKHRILLAIDGSVNLLLGILLLSFPAGLIEILGLPSATNYFYASILGGVIFGIGIALLVELWGAPRRVRGLGLGGAIAINVCGSAVLIGWLIAGNLVLPLRGKVILWIVAVLVLGIGMIEVATGSWRYGE